MMKPPAAKRLILLAALWLGGFADAAGITSSLPGFFTPGTPFTVTLSATPDATTQVFAVEETPPTNWVVDVISHGGSFDASTGRIKWGPFADATSRVLSYQITPTPGAVGTNSFSGRAAFDALLVPVAGARTTVKFPGSLARTQPSDYLPGVALAVTLAAAPAPDVTTWAVEELVPAGWNVSAISADGTFDAANRKVKWGPFFDPTARLLNYTVTPSVTSRAAGNFAALARFDAASLTDDASMPARPSRLTRNVPATYLPGVEFAVTLTVTPAPYVRTMALEETVPAGWTPISVSAGGVWDAANRKLKWGPFLESGVAETTFGYHLTPAPAAAQPLALTATARFDEVTAISVASVTRFLVHSENTVVRTLPPQYRPGQSLTVTLAATPIDTGLVYAVEESVPAGWTVTGISHGGVFDTANLLVKWGPFFDATATPRALSYQATPPANAFGSMVFAGTARFDRATLEITGATSVDNLPGSVTRSLPARYVPGVPFSVTLTATPVPGVETYAVEEEVPDGWTVSGLSDGGAYDALNRKLKWGPFLDRDLRPLVYTVTPAIAATGTNTFTGHGWFNGEDSPAGGTERIGLDRVPLAIPDSAGRHANSSVKVSVFKLLANDSDPDDDFLEVISVSPTSAHGANVQFEWPWIYYAPPDAFNGTDTFTYTVGDGFGGTATATVTVVVDSENNGPTRNIVSINVLPGDRVRVRFTGVPGFIYHIEVSPNASTWTRVADRTANSIGLFEFVDEDPITMPLRFYRSTWP